jgi:hypothetical protein
MAHQCSGRQLQSVMDFFLHNHPIIPPVVPLARDESGDVHSWTLGPMLEVVAADGGCSFLEERDTWKSYNRRTDGHTPMYISQRWMKIATNVMKCGDK